MSAEPRKHPDDWYCPAHSKQTGHPCGKRAGWGTKHLGDGLCRFHGGAGKSGERHAEKIVAVKAVAEFGLPRDVEPAAALIEELHRSAGWVAWLEQRVRDEGPDAVVTTAFTDDKVLTVTSPFYDLLERERKQLTAVASACIKAGVEERRVRVIEEQAAFAARAIRAALGNLGLDVDAPEVREAVTSALTVVPDAA